MSTDCTPRTGAQIRQSAGISTAYHEGRGSVIMRGTVAIEEDDASRGRKGRGSRSSGGPAIVITELPYQTNKATLPAASLSSWRGTACSPGPLTVHCRGQVACGCICASFALTLLPVLMWQEAGRGQHVTHQEDDRL